MNNKVDNHVWENHTIINAKWKEIVLHILAFLGCFIMIFLNIPSAIIWFFTLGHINFHRLILNTFNNLNDYLGGNN